MMKNTSQTDRYVSFGICQATAYAQQFRRGVITDFSKTIEYFVYTFHNNREHTCFLRQAPKSRVRLLRSIFLRIIINSFPLKESDNIVYGRQRLFQSEQFTFVHVTALHLNTHQAATHIYKILIRKGTLFQYTTKFPDQFKFVIDSINISQERNSIHPICSQRRKTSAFQ